MGGYAEAPPPAVVAPHAACVWRRTPGAGEQAGTLVLPDGCVDVLWHAGRLIVAGPDTTAQRAAPATGTTVGVRLRPGAASLLGAPAHALRDARVPVDALWGPDGRTLADAVAHAPDDAARLRLLVDAVARRAEGAAPVDPAVRAVVARAGAGPVAVAELAHRVGLSERQLRRRFLEHVGYGPRTLHRVLRLQRLLDRAIAAPDEGLAALAAHAGYADQAHLAREARALAGTTAAALVAGRRPARTSETSKTRTSRRARMAP